jgi:lipid-binding SYLF domain-containing protein
MYAEPLISLLAFVVSLGFFYGHRVFPARLGNAVAILDKFVDPSGHGILPEQIRQADCVAVIPGFKEASARDHTAFGRGFITCHNGDHWSAPSAVVLESSNPAVKIGNQKIDVVMLSMDSSRRPKLLSSRFTIGRDASAVWGNGKSEPTDRNSKVLCFARTKRALVEFDLDGAMLKPDDSGNKALYGRAMSYSEIIDGRVVAPKAAQVLVNKLTATLN